MKLTLTPAQQPTSKNTPQYRHRVAVELHEKAIKHHREAARLHETGDQRQADSHANIAHRHAVSALEKGAETINGT